MCSSPTVFEDMVSSAYCLASASTIGTAAVSIVDGERSLLTCEKELAKTQCCFSVVSGHRHACGQLHRNMMPTVLVAVSLSFLLYCCCDLLRIPCPVEQVKSITGCNMKFQGTIRMNR